MLSKLFTVTKISQFDVILLINQYVVRLQISVTNPLLVHEFQGAHNLGSIELGQIRCESF